ncbi:MAG: TrkH family potassium uptake protein [Clostridiales bacterium]|nr:TrkH family potassium uptake protein [Clostridiales bacterium]
MNLSISSVFRIIGIVLVVISIAMLPSFFVSAIYEETSVCLVFLPIIFVASLTGLFLAKFCKRQTIQLKVRDGFLIVTLCWFVATLLGSLPFVFTESIPNFIDAFFESCSGFSTTGSSILEDVEALPRGILFWRSFTHWLGGMGILVFAIALMPSLGISGQNIAISETTGPSLDKASPKMSDAAKALYTIYIFFTILETILLIFGGMNLYDALIHTFGTVGTGGFSSYNTSIAHFDSIYIQVVITVFMVLCGINFNLYFMTAKRRIGDLLGNLELKYYLGITLGVSVFISVMLYITNNCFTVRESITDAFFQTASIMTTTGYATADYETWPTACQILILLLMFIGGCSSSTSGGIKVIRIIVLLKLVRRGIATRLHPNVIENVKLGDKNIPGDTVSAIANHMFLYIVMVFAGTFIVAFENEDLLTCFSSVITCLGNIGPGFGAVGPTENFADFSDLSKTLLSVYMIAGRLELYTLFIMLMPRFWNPDR